MVPSSQNELYILVFNIWETDYFFLGVFFFFLAISALQRVLPFAGPVVICELFGFYIRQLGGRLRSTPTPHIFRWWSGETVSAKYV